MGIKTTLTLQKAQNLFPSFAITALQATLNGTVDTTYIASSKNTDYIIKKYEREIEDKIVLNARLLKKLSQAGLNVPRLITKEEDWYLYTKIEGSSPKTPTLFHIQAIGKFLAQLHKYTKNINATNNFFYNYPLKKTLYKYKKEHYYYYIKLNIFNYLDLQNDGFIHGDMFCDNILFANNTIGVIDFIDGGNGSFVFELGVAALSFNPLLRKSSLQMLLKSYNQHSNKKISITEVEKNIKIAAKFYALVRIIINNDIHRAKKLTKFW